MESHAIFVGVLSHGMAADFTAGIMGGLAGIVVGYPADTVKVRLQTQPMTSAQRPLYTGTMNCFATIVRNESIFGLYKGMTSPLIGVGLINALLFGVYGETIRRLQTMAGQPCTDRPTVSQVFIAGSVAGFVNTAISCPLELGKIQMQNQGITGANCAVLTPSRDKGPLDVLMRIYRERGVRGCFRGFTPTLLRETPSYGVYFAAYDILCRALTPAGGDVDKLPPGRLLLAGGLSGVYGWLSTYPLDVIKTRMQSADGLHYRSTLHCAIDLYMKEGPSVFVRGLAATLVRAFPTNAATLLTYTLCMRLFASSGLFKDTARSPGPHERIE